MTSKRRVITGVLVVLCGTLVGWAQEATVSDDLRLRAQLHAVKVENAQLRAALATAQAQLANAQLTVERAALDQEIRKTLGCSADAPIDWQTFASGSGAGACAPSSATTPEPKPPAVPQPKP